MICSCKRCRRLRREGRLEALLIVLTIVAINAAVVWGYQLLNAYYLATARETLP